MDSYYNDRRESPRRHDARRNERRNEDRRTLDRRTQASGWADVVALDNRTPRRKSDAPIFAVPQNFDAPRPAQNNRRSDDRRANDRRFCDRRAFSPEGNDRRAAARPNLLSAIFASAS